MTPIQENGIRSMIGKQPGMPTSDGAGVQLTRHIATPNLSVFDPFLLLDVFASDDPQAYIAGFPDHPHRGFETVTYLIEGKMRHKDSHGHEGVLGPGSVQWMTAGRGIIHSEMPEQENGLLRGVQLWVNLPSNLKMTDPAYQDIEADQFPIIDENQATVKLISGKYTGANGPATTRVPVNYLDVTLQTNADFSHQTEHDWNYFLVVLDGQLQIGGDTIDAGFSVFFDKGDSIQLKGTGVLNRFLLIGGQPIGEPIARSGPFVMNTKDEIMQAYTDYQTGNFG
ncbi:MAG: pirin family protein [Leptonema sp. (in: Bacteria)]|nr:pirin family protein [Leptonema sp. (in: bacteria)]